MHSNSTISIKIYYVIVFAGLTRLFSCVFVVVCAVVFIQLGSSRVSHGYSRSVSEQLMRTEQLSVSVRCRQLGSRPRTNLRERSDRHGRCRSTSLLLARVNCSPLSSQSSPHISVSRIWQFRISARPLSSDSSGTRQHEHRNPSPGFRFYIVPTNSLLERTHETAELRRHRASDSFAQQLL